MSESPETPAPAYPGPRYPGGATAPAARNSPLSPPAPKRLDPAAVMIGVGGVVLLLARLVAADHAATRPTTPASTRPGWRSWNSGSARWKACGASSARWAAGCRPLAPLEGRVQALETKPAAGHAGPPPAGRPARLAGGTRRGRRAQRRPGHRPRRRRMSAGCRASRPSRPSTPPPSPPRDALRCAGHAGSRRRPPASSRSTTDLGRRLQEVAQADQQREQAAQQAMQQKLAELARADEEREKAAAGARAAADRRSSDRLGQRIAALETGAEADEGAGEPHRAARRDRPAARRAAGRPAARRGRWRGSTSRRRRWPASPSRRRRPRRRCGCPSRMRRRRRALRPMPRCSRMAARPG